AASSRNCDVRYGTVGERGPRPGHRAIDVLRGEHEMAGRDLLLHRSPRRDADHAGRAELLERVEIRPVRDFARAEAVSGAVARDERDLLIAQPGQDDGIARVSEWRPHLLPADAAEAGQVVESGSTDD